jgi:hypothetical protein
MLMRRSGRYTCVRSPLYPASTRETSDFVRHSLVTLIHRTIKYDRQWDNQAFRPNRNPRRRYKTWFFFKGCRRWQAENYIPTHDKNVRSFVCMAMPKVGGMQLAVSMIFQLIMSFPDPSWFLPPPCLVARHHIHIPIARVPNKAFVRLLTSAERGRWEARQNPTTDRPQSDPSVESYPREDTHVECACSSVGRSTSQRVEIVPLDNPMRVTSRSLPGYCGK